MCLHCGLEWWQGLHFYCAKCSSGLRLPLKSIIVLILHFSMPFHWASLYMHKPKPKLKLMLTLKACCSTNRDTIEFSQDWFHGTLVMVSKNSICFVGWQPVTLTFVYMGTSRTSQISAIVAEGISLVLIL
jgi:hypothetical protein